MTVVRALVTNDDGIDSTGLGALARAAIAAGLDVVVAAPHTEHSGTSASLTALEADGRLVLREQRLPGLDVRALAVEATPGFIVFAAAHGAFGPPPEVVLSGINHGPNTGHATLHSGTVGAALTARTHRTPALAVSCVSAEPVHWDTCDHVATRAVSWLVERVGRDDPLTLSVNVPDLPLPELQGLRPARLAPFGAVQAEVGETGDDYVTLTFQAVDEDFEEDTDAGLLQAGWATVTPLAAPCEAVGVDLDGLSDTD